VDEISLQRPLLVGPSSRPFAHAVSGNASPSRLTGCEPLVNTFIVSLFDNDLMNGGKFNGVLMLRN